MNWEAMGEKLMKGKDADAIKSIASSPEAQRLERALDPEQVERAARSGDGAQLKALLHQVLSTEEGRALAEKLSGLGKTHE